MIINVRLWNVGGGGHLNQSCGSAADELTTQEALNRSISPATGRDDKKEGDIQE